MRKASLAAISLIIYLLWIGTAWAAISVPAKNGRVLDTANMIAADRLESLQQAAESGQESSTVSEARETTLPDIPNPEFAQTRETETTNISFNTILFIELIIVLIILVLVGLVLTAKNFLSTGLPIKLKLRGLRDHLTDQMVSASKLLEAVAPFTEMSKGTSRRIASEAESVLTELLIRVQQEVAELNQISLSFMNLIYKTRKLKETIVHYTECADRNAKSLRATNEKVQTLIEAEKAIVPFIASLKSMIEEAEDKIGYLSKSLGETPGLLTNRLQILKERTKQADDIHLFDSCEAMDKAKYAEAWAVKLVADLTDLLTYNAKAGLFPEEVQKYRQKINFVIEDSYLHQVEQTPYELVDQAESMQAELIQALKTGDIEKICAIYDKMTALLERALSSVNQTAEMRSALKDQFKETEQQFREADTVTQTLAKNLTLAKNQFDHSVWGTIAKDFQDANKKLADVEKKLMETQILIEDSQPDFELAKEILDKLIPRLEEIITVCQYCSTEIAGWEGRAKQAHALFRDIAAQYRKTQEFTIKERIIIAQGHYLADTVKNIETGLSSYRTLSDRPLLPLTELEKTCAVTKGAVKKLNDGVQKLHQIKINTEQQLVYLNAEFTRRYNKMPLFNKPSHAKTAFKIFKEQANQQLRAGSYENAERLLIRMSEIVNKLQG